MADSMDALGGFAILLEIRILDLASGSVPWNDPRGLDVRVERGMFCFLGRRVLILEVGDCSGCHGAPGGFTGHVAHGVLGLAADACSSRG